MVTKIVRSLRRWALVAVVLMLVVSAGAVALIGADRATASQEAVHRGDRISLARSLATLGAGYFLQLESSQANVAGALPKNVSGAQLTTAVSKLPGDPAAMVVGPSGSPVALGAGAGALAANWLQLDEILGQQLSAGGPAVSPVEHLDGHPTVVLALPLLGEAAGPRVLAVAYRLDALPIAAYVQQLRIGTGANAYLVDNAGRLVTSPNIAQVGGFASTDIRSQLATDRSDAVTLTKGSNPQVVAVAAVGLAGWHLVIIQPAPQFYGALWHANSVFRWLLLGFLIVVAAALLILHAKRQAALHAIAEMAVRDTLTGLPNRVAFTKTLNKAIDRHRRDGSDLALLFCDLDGFKAVNDRLGHDAGDLLLVASAQRLSAVASDALDVTATVARLGGDEFTVLLEGKQVRNQAMAVADAVTDAVAEPFVLGGNQVTVGVSVGVAFAHPERDLLQDADLAMYRMKAVHKSTSEAGSPDRFSVNPPESLRAV